MVDSAWRESIETSISYLYVFTGNVAEIECMFPPNSDINVYTISRVMQLFKHYFHIYDNIYISSVLGTLNIAHIHQQFCGYILI